MSICNDDFMMESSANVKEFAKERREIAKVNPLRLNASATSLGKGAKAIQQDVNLNMTSCSFKFRNVRIQRH
jgi:hypothetical protein